MSFGFSISDFLAVLELANTIRKEYADAPNQFKAILDEVRSLSIVIQDVDVDLSKHELNGQQLADLKQICNSCKTVLADLQDKLAKYSELESSKGNLATKVKRVWKRLKWEPDDIQDLRSRITSNVTLLNAFSRRISDQTAIATKKGVDRLVQQQRDEHVLAVLNWLTPVDYAPQQDDYYSRRQEGTGQWLLDSIKFQDWRENSKKTLFCPGIPGAGKTILTSIVVDSLITMFGNDPAIGLAYIYCNFKRKDEQRVNDLLASLLKQLAQGLPSLPDTLEELYKRHRREKSRPSLYEMAKCIQSVVALYSKVFILVDALDECQSCDNYRTSFLEEIFNLQDKCTVNVFATSRFIPEVTREFEDSDWLEIRATEEDVRTYLNGHLKPRKAFLKKNIELQNEIKEKIAAATMGMFLLAQLYLDSLMGKTTEKSVRNALETISAGSTVNGHAPEDAVARLYARVYGETMTRIEEQSEDEATLAKQALLWITCVTRPLSTGELQHALAVEVDQEDFDETNQPDVEDIISVCAGLVTVDEGSRIVRLIHYTTQEYFDRTKKPWFPSSEADIATACATYLSFNVFAVGPCKTDEDFEERLRLYQLYNYAVRNLGHHASGGICKGLVKFLQKGAHVQAAWQELRCAKYSFGNTGYSQRFARHATGLHLAAALGLLEAGKILLHTQVIDAMDTDGETPLMHAAERGHEAIVKWLLNAGADVNSRSKEGWTPLLSATGKGQEGVVKLLLNAGADVNLGNKNSSTPLLCAVTQGNEAMVRLLLDTDEVDVDSMNGDGRTPLSCASSYGREAILRLLLDTDKVDVDSRDKVGRTPLSYASRKGREAVVRILLDTGKVDVNSRDRKGRTPLSHASGNGHEAIVRQLLNTGKVDVNSRDKHGWTALGYASLDGHATVVRLLLDTGKVDVDSRDEHDCTPLFWAKRCGHDAVAKLLEQAGLGFTAGKREAFGQGVGGTDILDFDPN